jgi:hypothetical protein
MVLLRLSGGHRLRQLGGDPLSLPAIPDRFAHGDSLPGEAHRRLLISVDGRRLRFVIAYCISEGWVHKVAEDAEGKPKRGDDEFVEERVKGKVTVEYGQA